MSEAEAAAAITPEADATLPSDWVNSLPDNIKDAPFFKATKDGSIRTPDEVRAALDNAAKLQGNLAESHIKIPSPDAADDDKKQARERILTLFPDLRVVSDGEDSVPPEDHTGYKLPEGADALEAAGLEDIAKFALDHKWGQQQFSDYVTRMVDSSKTSTDARSQWEKDQGSKLTEKLGLARDSHLDRVASALQQSGVPERFINDVKAGKIDADIILGIDNLVTKMMDMGDEGSQFVQQVKTDARTKTPMEHMEAAEEIFKKLQELPKTSPRFAELNRKRIEHIGLAKGL